MLVKLGSVGADARRVQHEVNLIGYKPYLALDGTIGLASVAGIKWAQRSLGVTADGQWGDATEKAFRKRVTPTSKPAPIESKDNNVRATEWLERWIGPKEQYGPNDGPWLRAEEHKVGDDWMWKGHNPYCAEIGVKVAYYEAGVDLHHDFPSVNWAYCPSIVQCIRGNYRGGGRQWKPISVGNAKRGDVVLFDWDHNGVADHVGHIAGNAVPNGMLPTIEANTPSGDQGDQSGLGSGDGIWKRLRAPSTILQVGRLV